MRFDLITIFPEFFTGPLDYGIVRRAREARLIETHIHDLRNFTHDRHRTVDDRPFGGGEGMVMKCEPLFDAVESLVGPRSNTEAACPHSHRPALRRRQTFPPGNRATFRTTRPNHPDLRPLRRRRRTRRRAPRHRRNLHRRFRALRRRTRRRANSRRGNAPNSRCARQRRFHGE